MTDDRRHASPARGEGKIIRTRINAHAPRVSHEPWLGYTAHDCPRAAPLPVCPSPRCRRAKACLAAHKGLYCQRTHHALAEYRKLGLHSAAQKEVDAMPPVADRWDLKARQLRIKQVIEIGERYNGEMTARWKAGEFDHLYGKYSVRGVVLKPPPRAYAEKPEPEGSVPR
jgi:hypothetical protein